MGSTILLDEIAPEVMLNDDKTELPMLDWCNRLDVTILDPVGWREAQVPYRMPMKLRTFLSLLYASQFSPQSMKSLRVLREWQERMADGGLV